ncbi:MAG TPA: DUF5668 domain-containing protein [Lentimicrobium sp.]|nr:DUF5668 domain-containing protein [Lentimicrobium sp.]
MSYRKIFWGVLLVIIGTLFILKNLGIIYFDWGTIWRLWPLILILWGISLIPVKDYLKLIFSILAIGLSILVVSKYDKTGYYSFGWDKSYRDKQYNYPETDRWDSMSETQELFQSYESAIGRVELKLEAAAGTFRLEPSAPKDKLMTFVKKGSIGNYSMTSQDEGDKRTIELSIQDSRVKVDKVGNYVRLGLHPDPVWDLDLDIGAASIDFDLSNYKVSELEVDGGASSIKLRLGDLNDYSSVNINAGAATIDLYIPENVGAELRTETALSSKNFKGFKKISNGLFRTDNYTTATRKADIRIEAAVSSLSVIRYTKVEPETEEIEE